MSENPYIFIPTINFFMDPFLDLALLDEMQQDVARARFSSSNIKFFDVQCQLMTLKMQESGGNVSEKETFAFI